MTGRRRDALPEGTVIRAMRSGRVACGHHVTQGQKIAVRGKGWRRAWLCMECAVTEIPALRQRHGAQP